MVRKAHPQSGLYRLLLRTLRVLRGEILNDPRQLAIPAKRVGKLHLMRGFAFRFEQARTCNKNASASRARCSNVESIQAVEELHSMRRIFR